MRYGLQICSSVLSVGLSFAGTACSKRPRTIKTPPASTSIAVNGDADSDGFPDASELTSTADRENFRKWFTALAEEQFYEISNAWNPEQRDCAGLVRFAMREALRVHDRLWFQRMGQQYEPIAPEVRAYNLENSPLGERLFRTDFGIFRPSDLHESRFSEFADARTLKNYNTTFISRDRSQAQPGDLMFYEQAFSQKYPYHVMIFLGRARTTDEGASDWVVYHTGASPGDAGVIKKLRLETLDQHPDPRWRPVEHNRNFLGFFRFRILT